MNQRQVFIRNLEKQILVTASQVAKYLDLPIDKVIALAKQGVLVPVMSKPLLILGMRQVMEYNNERLHNANH
jgi:hypothetical protein